MFIIQQPPNADVGNVHQQEQDTSNEQNEKPTERQGFTLGLADRLPPSGMLAAVKQRQANSTFKELGGVEVLQYCEADQDGLSVHSLFDRMALDHDGSPRTGVKTGEQQALRRRQKKKQELLSASRKKGIFARALGGT